MCEPARGLLEGDFRSEFAGAFALAVPSEKLERPFGYGEPLLGLSEQRLKTFVLLGEQPCGRVGPGLGVSDGERLGCWGGECARDALREVEVVSFAAVGFLFARLA